MTLEAYNSTLHLVEDAVKKYKSNYKDDIKTKECVIKDLAVDLSYFSKFSKYLLMIILNYVEEDTIYKWRLPTGLSLCDMNYGVHNIYTRCVYFRFCYHPDTFSRHSCSQIAYRIVYKKNSKIDIFKYEYVGTQYFSDGDYHMYKIKILFDLNINSFDKMYSGSFFDSVYFDNIGYNIVYTHYSREVIRQ